MARIPEPAGLRLLKGRGRGLDSGGRKVEPIPGFRRIAPKPPTWLSREAAAEWRRVVLGLTRLDVLKEEDRAVLVAYVETWATFVAATRMVQRAGLTIQANRGNCRTRRLESRGTQPESYMRWRVTSGDASTESALARGADDMVFHDNFRIVLNGSRGLPIRVM